MIAAVLVLQSGVNSRLELQKKEMEALYHNQLIIRDAHKQLDKNYDELASETAAILRNHAQGIEKILDGFARYESRIKGNK